MRGKIVQMRVCLLKYPLQVVVFPSFISTRHMFRPGADIEILEGPTSTGSDVVGRMPRGGAQRRRVLVL